MENTCSKLVEITLKKEENLKNKQVVIYLIFSCPMLLPVFFLLLFLQVLFLEDKGLTLCLKWTKKGACSLKQHLLSLWDLSLPTYPGMTTVQAI